MRAKSFALLILALGCGLIASIGITQVISKKDSGTVAVSEDEVTIFIAAEDIPYAGVLTSQVLNMEAWPKDKVPPGALTKIEDIEGRQTRSKLFAGEAILENKLTPKGYKGAGVDMRIPPGYRAFPVKVDSVSGGSGMILPGSRVDVLVYVTRNPAQGILETGITEVLQDIKVFAVDSTVDVESEDSEPRTMAAKTISLLLTLTQTKKLMLAVELGKVRLVMRSPEDDETVDPTTVGFAQVFGDGREVGDRSTENPILAVEDTTSGKQGGGFLGMLEDQARQAMASSLPPVAEIQPDNTVRRTMRIVRGGVVEDVILEMEEERLASRPGSQRWRVAESQFGADYRPPAEPAALTLPEPSLEPEAEETEPSTEDEPSEDED